jgi:hypothetical protein
MEIRVTRNVASLEHPLHHHFMQWVKANKLPANRESGLKYVRRYPNMMKHYSTPKKG